MSVLDAIILGLVQGFTEFLPISSSGHLVMAQWFMDIPAAGVVVEVVLHFATLLSVIIVYRQRLFRLVVGAMGRERDAWGYIGLLALASVPAGIVGFGFAEPIEGLFDVPAVTGFMLLVTGMLLWSTRWVDPDRADERIPAAVALGMGIAQAFAILPGISRSGATITAGLWGRIDAERAAEFSFLMSIPAIAGAVVLQMGEMEASFQSIGPGVIGSGFLAALVSGVVAIRSLIWLVRRQAFHAFAYYVWPVGLIFLGVLWTRA